MDKKELNNYNDKYLKFIFNKQKDDEDGIKSFDKFKNDEEYIFKCHEKYYENWWCVVERCNKIKNLYNY